MDKYLRITGALFGLLAVLFGAFGAHGLEKLVDAQAITTFETGVRYQMYHALLLLVIPTFSMSLRSKKIILVLLTVGIILFSGSIYGLATNDLSQFDFKKIALITPVGGSLLILSWVLLLRGFVKLR